MPIRFCSCGTVLVLLALAVPAGCGGGATATVTPTRPTPLVMVRGDRAHALGRELSRGVDGSVEVELHEGSRLWVDGDQVRNVVLDAGDRVVVRWNQATALYPAVVIERLDDLVRVRFDSDETVALVSISDVLSVLEEGTSLTEDADEGEEPPAIDLERQAAFGALDAWAPALVTECGDEVTMLLPGGERRSMPMSEVTTRGLEAGETVMARYQDGALSYRGTIMAVDGADISVRYTDGTEETLTADQVTWVLRAPSEEGQLAATDRACRRAGQRNPPMVLARVGRYHQLGEVRSCDGEQVTLVDRHGEIARVAREGLGRPAVRIGDQARVRYGAEWFLAAVTGVSGAAVTVLYEDQTVGDVTLGDLDLLGPAQVPGEPPTCP